MQRASRSTGGRRVIARGTVVACGVMLAVAFLVAGASAGAIDPPAGTWTPVSSPPVSASILASVSCVTGSDCWAVGFSESNQLKDNSLTERWNGANWTIVSTPDRANDQLSSIDCVSSTDCWSVGSTASAVLIEHWNGTDWSIVPTPPVTGMSQLSSVTCTSSNDCWAVGYRAVEKARTICPNMPWPNTGMALRGRLSPSPTVRSAKCTHPRTSLE